MGRSEVSLWTRVSWVTTLLSALLLGCSSVTRVTEVPEPTAAEEGPVTAEPTETAGPATRTSTPIRETASPTPTATHRPGPSPSPTGEEREVTFTIVYDNNPYVGAAEDGLQTAWGFACWVKTDETTVLFDTGRDGAMLLSNLKTLHLDPLSVDAVVLSHPHGDHIGGLNALLKTGARPTVYAPASFSQSFKAGVRAQTDLVEVSDATAIAPSIYSTGEVGTGLVEQALVVDTMEGLVVVTGCAHPGVVDMVCRARDRFGGGIALVMGGFHLRNTGRRGIRDIIEEFDGLEVERVAPCHCTGDRARELFEEALDEKCTLAGVGWSTELTLSPSE